MKLILLRVLGGLTMATGSALGYLALGQPAIAPAPSIRIEMTPERVARGRHLFENVAACQNCHSPRDWQRFGGPVVGQKRGAGRVLPPEMGLPGRVVASNLTPDRETGLGGWSDGEKMRAIREGVSRDGRALHPVMPYATYRRMSDEDTMALVAYMNSMPAVRNPLPRTDLDWVTRVKIRSLPKPLGRRVAPVDPRDARAYGEYLASIASCARCHGETMAGGKSFRSANGTVVSANITPDADTGIGAWTEERFVQRFQHHQHDLPAAPPATEFNYTVMPWLRMSRLSCEELSALYAYLQTKPPARNAVDKHPLVD